ncbi:hypothetical protein RRF57_007280 [Xylaria bambusicola]|uniref:Uncharacterized protein n=1 Tax=Xylaria bambusicola TaxID=326684 RepID=A0AAN7ZAB1_9PEZI
MAASSGIRDKTESTSSWLGGIQSWFSSLLQVCRDPSTDMQPGKLDGVEKQVTRSAPYVPQYAGASFSRTATSREMRRQNEIL